MVLLAISPKPIFHILHWLVFNHILYGGQGIGEFEHINSFEYHVFHYYHHHGNSNLHKKGIMDNILTWDLLKFDGRSNRPDSLQITINPSQQNDDDDSDHAGNE